MSKKCSCVYYDNGKCKKFSDNEVTSWCIEGPCKDETPSNADKIRAMSDDELMNWLGVYMDCCLCPVSVNCTRGKSCEALLYEWLKQPAETTTMNVDRCVCCGEIIPEGTMVCPNCLVAVNERR